jgi:hypothetical protein
MSSTAPEAKAKVRERRQNAILEYQKWLTRQTAPPSHAMKVEMFDFFIDEAVKKR